jgi:hypothetical protein
VLHLDFQGVLLLCSSLIHFIFLNVLLLLLAPCVILVFSAKSLLLRHGGGGVSKRKLTFFVAQKVQFQGSFCIPFWEDLLTWLYLGLALIHSSSHEECNRLTTFSLMDSWNLQKGIQKHQFAWIGASMEACAQKQVHCPSIIHFRHSSVLECSAYRVGTHPSFVGGITSSWSMVCINLQNWLYHLCQKGVSFGL